MFILLAFQVKVYTKWVIYSLVISYLLLLYLDCSYYVVRSGEKDRAESHYRNFAYSKYHPEAEKHKFKDSGMIESSSW